MVFVRLFGLNPKLPTLAECLNEAGSEGEGAIKPESPLYLLRAYWPLLIKTGKADGLLSAGWEVSEDFPEVPAAGLRKQLWTPARWGK